MKLSEYAKLHNITYHAAWHRFTKGRIPGAAKDEYGRIHVPDPKPDLSRVAVIYSRVSTSGQRDGLVRQSERLKLFASARGYVIAEVVEEVASGVNDSRPKLERLLRNHENWGTLVVEHRDRLTRVGYGWFPTMLGLLGKTMIVMDESTDSDEGRMEDIFSILYSYAAREYGKRGARNRAERAAKALEQ